MSTLKQLAPSNVSLKRADSARTPAHANGIDIKLVELLECKVRCPHGWEPRNLKNRQSSRSLRHKTEVTGRKCQLYPEHENLQSTLNASE